MRPAHTAPASCPLVAPTLSSHIRAELEGWLLWDGASLKPMPTSSRLWARSTCGAAFPSMLALRGRSTGRGGSGLETGCHGLPTTQHICRALHVTRRVYRQADDEGTSKPSP